MTDFLNSCLEMFRERLKNPVVPTFVLSFSIVNWERIFILFASDIGTLEKIERFNDGDLAYLFWIRLLWPALITGFWLFLMPKLARWVIKKMRNDQKSRLRQEIEWHKFAVLQRDSLATAEMKLAEKKARIRELELTETPAGKAARIQKERMAGLDLSVMKPLAVISSSGPRPRQYQISIRIENNSDHRITIPKVRVGFADFVSGELAVLHGETEIKRPGFEVGTGETIVIKSPSHPWESEVALHEVLVTADEFPMPLTFKPDENGELVLVDPVD